MQERPGTDPPTTQPGPESSQGRSVWSWLLPALTLVAGVALGASVVAAGTAGDDGEESRASPSVSAEPSDPAAGAGASTSEEDLLVRVPAACLQAADGAEEAAGQFDDVAEAVGALDAGRLQELVDRFQQLQPEIQRHAEECRSTAGAQVGDGTLVTPTPTPTP